MSNKLFSDLSILVLCYNNYNLTRTFIKKNANDEVFWCFVDNGSSPEELDKAMKIVDENDFTVYFLNSTKKFVCERRGSGNGVFIKTGSNLGYAKGNNIGLNFLSKYSNRKFVAVSNDDVFWTDDSLLKMLAFFKKKENIFGVSPVIKGPRGERNLGCKNVGIEIALYRFFYPISFFIRHFSGSKRNSFKTREMQKDEFASGCFFIVNLSKFEKIGFFDPKTFLGSEESILSSKIYKAKYKMFFLANVSVLHLGGATGIKVLGLRKHNLNFIESDCYYLRKYKKYNLVSVWFYKIASVYFIFVWGPLLITVRKILFKLKRM